ncbi:glutamate decarboxylase [Actinopolyspora biskrensis]|uniref:glutamate decarboxylase n=1 Tax=Actinopolyspora biskrensis TaxID=1470178 RepID=A0A852YU38_9ACTN|nr:pyridoxal-dependent decarboxylase [Actinopolyspora biskrensis]NYH77478.1 glutamate decarboxylase [Actinopolyspora biskrensis]
MPGTGPVDVDFLEAPCSQETAEEVIRDVTRSDIPPSRNLGTFVSPECDPHIDTLVRRWSRHNLINRAEYPGVTILEHRCLAMLRHLWHGSADTGGCATTGSSEAAVIAAAELLRRWRKQNHDQQPNLVLGPTAHTCWLRFCMFWNVEPRLLPPRQGEPISDPAAVASSCDAGTIGAVATLGSPEFGLYDPVHEVSTALDELHARTGLDIPLHVDAASGGFVAPFLQPEFPWDFRLDRVVSINASGHKYGLTRPSVGWLLWRTSWSTMDELALAAPYIGTGAPEPTLSFSRPSAPVVEQYLQLIRRGRSGYRATHLRSRDIAERVARQLAEQPDIEVLSGGSDLPVVTFTAGSPASAAVTDLTTSLADKGWHIPVYQSRTPTHPTTGRIVVRSDMSSDLVDELTTDIARASHTFAAKGES